MRTLLLAALVAVLTLLAPSATAQGEGRTIVLGMDGADAEMAGDWMDQGLRVPVPERHQARVGVQIDDHACIHAGERDSSEIGLQG